MVGDVVVPPGFTGTCDSILGCCSRGSVADFVARVTPLSFEPSFASLSACISSKTFDFGDATAGLLAFGGLTLVNSRIIPG